MFDIDIITLAISAVAMIAFALPFYFASRKINKKKVLALKQIEDFIQSQNLTIQIRDIWRNQYFIGLDTVKGVLVYCEHLDNSSPVLIDLKKINQVAIEEAAHVVGNMTNSHKVLDKLTLSMTDEHNRKIQGLEFYDGDKYSDLNGEAVLIKKWELLIREQVTSHKSKFQTA